MDLPPLKATFKPGRHSSNGVFGREDLHIWQFWQHALISHPLAFSMQAFAPVILARVRNVALLVFGKLFYGDGVYSRLSFACGYLLYSLCLFSALRLFQPVGAAIHT